jgi:DNA-binding transcriptional LysR family regulator
MESMNYESLASFTVFADLLNFTHAARALHLTQPALHGRIRKLADEIGKPLYLRRGRTLVLTPEGRRLAAFGREARSREADLLDELRGADPRSGVVLAAGRGAFLHLLGPAIRRFTKHRRPLRLLTMNATQAVSAVFDALADVGVAALARPPLDLDATLLTEVGQCVVVPRSHRLAKRRVVRPADLDGEAIVVAPPGSPHRSVLELALANARVSWQVAVETTGWDLMLEFSRQGLGITVVNDFCAPPAGMVMRPLEGTARARYYLLRRRTEMSEALRTLVDLVISTVSARGKP